MSGQKLSRLFWIVACLALLPMAGAVAQQAPPGVGDGRYTNPTYGFSITWDTEIWEPKDAQFPAGVEGIVLESRSSDFLVTAHPLTESSEGIVARGAAEQACAEAYIADVRALGGTHSLLVGPTGGSALIHTTAADANGQPFQVVRRIDCVSPAGASYIVRFVHYSLTDAFESLEPSAFAIRSSLRQTAPPPEGTRSLPGEPRLGLIEFDVLPVNLGAGTEDDIQFLTVDIVITNVDSHNFDSEVDAGRIMIDGIGPATTFAWLTDGENQTGSIMTVRPDQPITGRFTFVVPTGTPTLTICYQSADGSECIDLAVLNIADGNFAGRGVGIRPRIDPGR